MKRLILIFFLCSFLGCSSKKTTTESTSPEELNSGELKRSGESVELIRGIWAESETENAIFVVEEDSIFYFEQDTRVKYEIIGDTLLIYYDGYIAKNQILKMTEDSLVFKTEVDFVNRLYKRK